MKNHRCVLIFEQAIKSEKTKKVYLDQLNKFKEWAKIKNFDGLLQAPHKDIQILLEDYVMYLKTKVSPNTIPIYFAPIELFYIMNDVNANFKKIRKLFPDKVKKGNERGYTRKEVQLILNSAKSRRSQALILLLASSGCRLGSIPGMRLKHLSRMEESYSIKIYEGDKEEDFIFTTSEATKAIDSYLEERRHDGEHLDDESPLFRLSYQIGIQKVKSCSVDNLTHITGRLVTVIDRKKTYNNRYDVPKNHGFRKFYATVIKQTNGITPTMTEKLINHVGIVQMDSAYFTPSVQEMFEAYKKSIPNLIISDHDRMEQENKKLEEKKIILDSQQKEIEILKLKVERMMNTIEIKQN